MLASSGVVRGTLNISFFLQNLLNSQAQQAGEVAEFSENLDMFFLLVLGRAGGGEWCFCSSADLLLAGISYSVDRSLLLLAWLRVLSVCSVAVVPWWTSLSV